MPAFDKRFQQTNPPRRHPSATIYEGRRTFGDKTYGDDYGGARDPESYPEVDWRDFNAGARPNVMDAPDHEERVFGYDKIRRRGGD